MSVVGTAGHVDHGKSSLVRALTGTDPDRWAEERERGLTIDLGFARLRYPDGVEAAVVDVPGHERFLHNMLAGAAALEIALVVVAANEGPRPQTFEHLAVLEYANVRRAIVVLSKIDLVEPAERATAAQRVRDALGDTLAAGAPLVAVSTVTGEGLDDVRDALHAALLGLPAPRLDAPALLPIDRVFSLPGHGTIVTGTLSQGSIAVGDIMRLWPLGREVRVRGLEVFGEKRERVAASARVAVNLPGVERSELRRGAVLANLVLEPAETLEVIFRPSAAALALLKRRTPVRAYVGAAEVLGTLVVASVPADAAPVAATLHLRAPVVAAGAATYVVRGFSPKTLLGGGTLRPVASAASGEAESILAVLRDAGLGGATVSAVAGAANLRAEVAGGMLADLAGAGRVLALRRPAGYVDAALADGAVANVTARLVQSEAEMPWLAGMTGLALARATGLPEPALTRVLFAAAASGRLAHRGGYFTTEGFTPRLSDEQRAFFEQSFGSAGTGGPLPLDLLRGRIGGAKIRGLAQAFDTLLETGSLVKVGDAVYRGERIAAIRAQLESALRRDRQITPAGFRDLIGTSRKFAVPLLEWFDAHGVTLRSGDVRVLRS